MPSRFRHSRRERNRINRIQPGAEVDQWRGDREKVAAPDGAGAQAAGEVEERVEQVAGDKAQVAAAGKAGAGVKVVVKPQKRPEKYSVP